ncbi:hypothetical protein KY343_01535, partial [Candidatus Woesearchaeota archaeon]|nr:hypothetical protein [Candidatus Woesearchaeota archaeon]
LLGVIVLYLAVWLFSSEIIIKSLQFFLMIIKRIIPVFILVFVLMVLINYFIKPKRIVNYFGKKAGIKGWIISITAGLLSTGPMYMWYPLLNQMQKKGVKNRFITAFLYNRAIKLPLLPLLIFYFGWAYTIILTMVMIIASVFQGIIVEKILEV